MADVTPNITAQYNIASDPAGEKIAGGQLFNVIATLNNHSSKEYILPNRNIIELAIEENLLNWPYRGYIIYSNKFEGIERNTHQDAWFYRMDARDEINIKIKVVPDEGMTQEYPPEIWEMDLDFVVYDTEDIPAPSIASKLKKIYFWDKRYQMMLDKKIYWSTATAQKLKDAAYLPDIKRAMLTGNAIEKLLTDAAGYPDSIDKQNWDVGANNVFYTSPTDSSLADDLSKLISMHLSEKEGDNAIFKYNNRIEKKWQLIPVHKFFDKAGKSSEAPGEWQLEHYFFEDVESDGSDTTPFRAPFSNDLSFKVDIKILERNRITMYEFADMSGIDNSKALVSKPVYYYCFNNRVFGMDYEEHEIEKVKSEFKRLYTDKLLPAGKAVPIFTLNKTKKEQINVQPEFTFARTSLIDTKTSRLNNGKGKILYGGLMLNEFLKFRVLGSPHRTIGKFIGIDRKTSDLTLKFDNKICGQWFVTGVKHVWNHNRYVNDICAVKVHMYEDNGVKEDVE